jgi:thiol-disulfide isomerase/thioredoxin
MRLTVPALLVAALMTAAAPAFAQVDSKPAEKAPAKPAATLAVGDSAPALSIAKWLKGAPVTAFEKDKVYVVEFWATWCGPCIAGMPHLSALQKEFKDKVTIIGVSTIDNRKPMPNTLEASVKMVADKGDTMGYTVAWDNETATKDAFFKAAGQQGIPCAFVVDKQGKIAYIGHPMFLDLVLDKVVAGKWDAKAGNEEVKSLEDKLYGKKGMYAQSRENPADAMKTYKELEAKYPTVMADQVEFLYSVAKQSGDAAATHKAGLAVIDKYVKDKNAMGLNAFAWPMVDPQGEAKNPDLELALKAAEEGVKLTNNKDGMILDTLARVYWVKGDKAKAIEIQTKAVENAPAEAKDDIEATLKEYKSSK